IVFGAGRDAAKLIELWREWFEVGRVAPCMDRIERLAELGRDRTACIVAFPEDYDVTLVLRKDVALDRIPTLGRTPAVRTLDVARIETLVVQYRSEEHTSELQSRFDLVCRLLLEKKKSKEKQPT